MKNLYFLFNGYLRAERISSRCEVDSIKSIKIIVGNGNWKKLLYELIEMTLMMFLEDASSERKE